MSGPAAVLRSPLKRPGGHSLLGVTEDLLTVPALDEPGASPARWENGFWLLPNCGTGEGAWVPCPEPGDEKVRPDAPEAIEWSPIQHYASFECSTFGFESVAFRQRAEQALARVLARRVETEFWTGALAQAASYDNPYLASPDAEEIDGGIEQSLQEGLRLLQQALGDCLGDEPGDIHAPRRLVTAWQEHRLIEREVIDGVVHLHDLYGNRVIAGSGYDGRGPGDIAPPADDTLLWAYGTAPTYHVLGDVTVVPDEVGQALDRGSNDEWWLAERVAGAVWAGCCHLAVLVSVCDTCCTSDVGS